MPIRIDNCSSAEDEEKDQNFAWLCDDDWELPTQIDTLEKWLMNTGKTLPSGSYIADIGFCPREDAGGGGGVLTYQAMEIMVKIGMDVYFSEYPGFDESAE